MKRAVFLSAIGMVIACAGTAHAGVTICNQFDEPVYFALGYSDASGPLSTGWFNLDVGKCDTYLADAKAPFFVYGESESSQNGWDAADDEPGQDFCLSTDDSFTIRNSENMADGALVCDEDMRDRFAAVTDKQNGAEAFTFTTDNAK